MEIILQVSLPGNSRLESLRITMEPETAESIGTQMKIHAGTAARWTANRQA
jgi:hypothetical protein